MAKVRDRAELCALAVGAWIGQIAVAEATGRDRPAERLPDLVRLHADVAALHRAAGGDDDHHDLVERLLVRLTIAIDSVVAEQEAAQRP